ncbi:MAG: class I SAM-dependent methyltransferase [Chlamydiales bacterium]
MSYTLLDSGHQRKLERFGSHVLIRPCAQALWMPALADQAWKEADAVFTRDEKNSWNAKKPLPASWRVELGGIKFKIAPTDFGHLGLFPEHSLFWPWMQQLIRKRGKGVRVLNLFAYSGGATLAAAQAGASVCHLDASKGMVSWARENAALNGLEGAPIRWIVDDVLKFLTREEKRGSCYDGIIVDPPSFGRGKQGETFIIERDLQLILDKCEKLFSDHPLFWIFTTHTPGMTPLVMKQLMEKRLKGGVWESGEMQLPSATSWTVPSGSYARWEEKK